MPPSVPSVVGVGLSIADLHQDSERHLAMLRRARLEQCSIQAEVACGERYRNRRALRENLAMAHPGPAYFELFKVGRTC